MDNQPTPPPRYSDQLGPSDKEILDLCLYRITSVHQRSEQLAEYIMSGNWTTGSVTLRSMNNDLQILAGLVNSMLEKQKP